MSQERSGNGHVDQLEELPSLSRAFKGLLKPGGPTVAALPRAERFAIKCAVEELAARQRRKVRDIVLHYGISLDEYFYQVDPLTSAEPPPKRRANDTGRSQLKHASLSGYSAAEKLVLLEQVDDLVRFHHQDLCIACEAVGVYTRQYYKLDAQRADLQRQAAQSTTTLQAPVIRTGEHIVIPEEERPVVVDAANVLSIVSRESIRRAATLLGATYPELQDWKDAIGREWIYPMQGRKPELPLGRELLTIPTADKFRALEAFAYLEGPLRQSRYQIATTLGYREDTVRQWAKIKKAIDRCLAERSESDARTTLSFAEVQRMCSYTGETQAGLQTWIKAAGLKDAYMQVSLPGGIRPGLPLEPQQLMRLWEAQWSGVIDPQQLDTLVRYYLPVADFYAAAAVRRTNRVLRADIAQSYARVGLLDVVRRYDLGHNTKFMTYAGLRITGEIWDGVRDDDTASRLARSWSKKLQEAESQWSMEHHRKPSDEELACVLSITPQRLKDIRFSLASTHVESIDAILDANDEGRARSRLDYLENAAEAVPSAIEGEVLQTLLSGLTTAQQAVIIGYYVANKTMKQIGAELNLSESRISQMHAELLEQLAERIADHEGRDDILGLICQAYTVRQEAVA